MSKSIMSIAVMYAFELTEGMSQEAKEDIIEWLDPDLPSMILITPMQLFRGLPMHPIMIKWEGKFCAFFAVCFSCQKTIISYIHKDSVTVCNLDTFDIPWLHINFDTPDTLLQNDISDTLFTN